MRWILLLMYISGASLVSSVQLPLVAQQNLPAGTLASDTIWLDPPLHDGDVLVHRSSNGEYLIQRHRFTGRKIYWVGLPAPQILWCEDRSFSISIAENGNVVYSPEDAFGDRTPVEYYPAYIPESDSILISQTWWRVTSRFDTTIFSVPVRAFTLQNDDTYYKKRLTVADKFGVVSETGYFGEFFLQSAVIDGVKYNRNAMKRRIFPLCEGSIYIHSRGGGDGSISVNDTVRSAIVRDTLVNGVRYLWFELPAFRTYTGDSLSDLRGWFRETEDGLLAIDSSLAFPAAADIGDATPLGVITEIFQREYNGIERHVYVGSDIAYHYFHSDTLVEGIGIVFTSDGGMIDFPRSWRLIGGVICGEPWGIPLTVSETPVAPEQSAMQLYPNPASAETDFIKVRITGTEGGTVQLSLHDLLGREFQNHKIEYVPPGIEYTIALRDLPTGMYLVRMQTGKRTTSRNLLLLR